MKTDVAFMKFMPSCLPKGRIPDRSYFFDVLNTVHEEFLSALIKHASEQRNSASNENMAEKVIDISEEWWAKLNALPFKSSKCILY